MEQARAVAGRHVSPRELVDAALSALHRLQPALNSFTVVLDEDACVRARDLEGREPVSPLHGVPVVVKDLFDVEGLRTTGCCAAYAARDPAARDSAVVERLRAAGAIVIAKTNQHELALGTTNQVSSHGPAYNPWDATRIPGGSSGGSAAAVAAGVVALAMGSDTAGSIRIPSSYCGVTGLKPTHGAVSLRGAMPLRPSLDVAGPIAHGAADCLSAYGVLRGFDATDTLSADADDLAQMSARGLRVGLPTPWYADADAEVAKAVGEAARVVESLGAELVEVSRPRIDEAAEAFALCGAAEIAHCYRDLWDDDRVGRAVAVALERGRAQQAVDYVRGIELSRTVRRDFALALADVDVLLTPCTPTAAPVAQDAVADPARVRLRTLPLTLPVSVALLPAVAFPVGLSSDGLPLGAQLVGRPWTDSGLLGVVAELQAQTDWHTLAPRR